MLKLRSSPNTSWRIRLKFTAVIARSFPTRFSKSHSIRFSPSSRHQSGYALRFPRIARIRTDKSLAEIDTLETCRRLATASFADSSVPKAAAS